MRISEPGGASSKPAASPSPAQRVRSTVIDWTRNATRGEHQTTAGEVAGRGEFPGVPGYSTLDNWARSKETGTYTAPDYVSQLLQQAGYAPPVPEGTGRQSINGLNFDAADALTPYGYSVTDDEASKILETYAPDAKGSPEKLSKQRVESKDRAVPMTRAAYDKLSSDQQAAVDFNTALIAAREKDLNSGWMIQVPADERAAQGAGLLRNPKFESESSKRMKEIFGEDALTGGNPEHTMALLERIGYKGPDSDLTDFMSLDMAVTADELKNFRLPQGSLLAAPKPADAPADWSPEGQYVPGDPSKLGVQKAEASPDEDTSVAPDYAKIRSAENLGMLQLEAIRRASERLGAYRRANSNRPEWSPSSTVMDALGDDSLRVGAVPLGWGTDRSTFATPEEKAKNSDFQKIFEGLQGDKTKTKLADSKAFWAGLSKVGATEKDIDQLFKFIDQRTRWMIANNVTTPAGKNDAKIIRELAGLGPLNG